MPPPSLSATVPDEEVSRSTPPPSTSATATTADQKDLRPVLFPIKQPPIQVIPITDSRLIDEEDEDEDEEDGEEDEEDGEDDDEDEEEEEDDDETTEKMLNRKRSIPSFSKSQQPSTSMTKSYAMSTSPPSSSSTSVMSTSASSTSSTEQEPSKSRWLETIAQLRRSLTLSNSRQQQQQQQQQQPQQPQDSSDTNPPLSARKSNFIPMPLPPKRNVRKKRRSEATTQPRFNPETNTYTRDTRSNPDHLRMISAELNMMRHRKLSSPLKPRGFLPRRTDAFIRGQQRKLSALKNEL
ncbi:unnamed protein product [Mucor fragilis]